MSKKMQHDFGLAAIKRVVMQKPRQGPEVQKMGFTAEQSKTGRDAIFPQTWAAVVATPTPQRTQPIRCTKKDSRRAWDVPVERAGELEHIIQCDGRWRKHTRKRWGVWEPTNACVGHTMANANLVELITPAVAAAMVAVDAQLRALQPEIIAMTSRTLVTDRVCMMLMRPLENIESTSAESTANPNVIPHLSLVVRSVIAVGGWTDFAAVVVEASAMGSATCFCARWTWEQSRCSACKSYCHALTL